MPAILTPLFTKAGIVGMIIVGLLLLFGALEARLHLALHGETTAKASLATTRGDLTASEQLRTAEYASATKALSASELACAARVAEAHRSATAIHTLMEKPYGTDPKSGCPIRALLGAGELRNAVQARP